MSKEEKTPGVLIHTIPYLGKQKILKVFTPEHGLVSLMSMSLKTTALTTPFCIAEWVYRVGSREIHNLKDATLIDPLSELKTSYPLLAATGAMAQDLIKTQLPGKNAESLYTLFCLYLKKLPEFETPEVLAASFRLKILIHEGLLSLEQEEIFTSSEWEQVCTLAYSRQFSSMKGVKKIPSEKIKLLFENRL